MPEMKPRKVCENSGSLGQIQSLFFFFTVSFTSSISRILICEIMNEWFNERKNTAVYKVLVDYNICVCVCPIC